MLKLPQGTNTLANRFCSHEKAYCSHPAITDWVLVGESQGFGDYLILDPVIRVINTGWLWKQEDILAWNEINLEEINELRKLFSCPKN